MRTEHQLDRRQATRVTVAVAAVDVELGTRLHATDLSLGGARLETREARATGSSVELELMLPGGAPLRVRGVVAASSPNSVHVSFRGLRRMELVRLAESLW